jgi:hypothetical protein
MSTRLTIVRRRIIVSIINVSFDHRPHDSDQLAEGKQFIFEKRTKKLLVPGRAGETATAPVCKRFCGFLK